MNKNLPKSRTSLFLMELIICILFFSIASAVCMQLFAKAHTLDQKTRELNHAVAIAQSFAEVMRGTDGSKDAILTQFPDAIDNEDYLEVFYDEDFHPCDHSVAVYAGDVTIEPNGPVQNMLIRVVRLSDYSEIYRLNATKYRNKPQG